MNESLPKSDKIYLQQSVPGALQNDSVWIMNAASTQHYTRVRLVGWLAGWLDAPKAYSARRVMMSHRNYVTAAARPASQPSRRDSLPKTIIIVAVGCFPVIFLPHKMEERGLGGDHEVSGRLGETRADPR